MIGSAEPSRGRDDTVEQQDGKLHQVQVDDVSEAVDIPGKEGADGAQPNARRLLRAL